MAKAGRLVGAIIVLVGAVLLIAALFMPWYTWQTTASEGGASITGTINTYPGLPSTNGTVQYSYSCTNVPSGFCPNSTSDSYSHLNLNSTGQVAETGFFLLITGFVIGLIGAIIGLTSGKNSRRAGPAMALGAVAMILAVAAFGLFAVTLPGAISNDSKGHSGDGPWSSFIGSGSTNYSGIPATDTWGPAIGWYLTIGAFGVLLIGVILLAVSRKSPPEPTPVSVPAPTATPSGSEATASAPPTN